MHGPDPAAHCPVPAHPRIAFLRNIVSNPRIEVGEYSYYDDPDGPEAFEDRCVRYLFPFMEDRLRIGRFTAVASGACFIMNGANHAMTGFSTYPFNIFGNGWDNGFDFATVQAGFRGDTVVGNDVWIGADVTVLPGVTIGDGAIIGTRSVVSRDVPPYAVVAGNPARVVRMRFPEETVARLLAVAWWHWPAERITRNLSAIRAADIDRLEEAA